MQRQADPRWPFLARSFDRFVVIKVDWTDRGEPPTYEVRKNPGGTSCDWDPGLCIAVYDNDAEAQEHRNRLAQGGDSVTP